MHVDIIFFLLYICPFSTGIPHGSALAGKFHQYTSFVKFEVLQSIGMVRKDKIIPIYRDLECWAFRLVTGIGHVLLKLSTWKHDCKHDGQIWQSFSFAPPLVCVGCYVTSTDFISIFTIKVNVTLISLLGCFTILCFCVSYFFLILVFDNIWNNTLPLLKICV